MEHILRCPHGETVITSDDWTLIRHEHSGCEDPGVRQILPFAQWQTQPERQNTGVWLAAEDRFEDVLPALCEAPIIAIDFATARDGRGYTTAHLLRVRHGYSGDLRAIGEVYPDHLHYLRRCGFSSFSLAAGQDPAEALRCMTPFSHSYQGAADDPEPLFQQTLGGSVRLPLRRALEQTPYRPSPIKRRGQVRITLCGKSQNNAHPATVSKALRLIKQPD